MSTRFWRPGASLAAVALAGCQIIIPGQVSIEGLLGRDAGPTPGLTPGVPLIQLSPTPAADSGVTGGIDLAPPDSTPTPSPSASQSYANSPSPTPSGTLLAAPDLRNIYRIYLKRETRNGAPGEQIDLAGDRFGFTQGRPFEVRFGTAVASDASRLSDNAIRVTIPSNARNGMVKIVVDGVESPPLYFQVLTRFEMYCPDTAIVVGEERQFEPDAFDSDGQRILRTWSGAGVLERWPYVWYSVTTSPVDIALIDDKGVLKAWGPGSVRVGVMAGDLPPQACNQTIVDSSPTPAPTASPLQATVTTYAGVGGVGGFGDGYRTEAAFKYPAGLAVDRTGRLVLADSGNQLIREISASGTVNTLAGSGIAGYLDGRFGTARFKEPSGIAVDGEGNVFVSDMGNGCIRKITPQGEVSTIAQGFNRPGGITVDRFGNVYVADTANHRIRVIAPGGAVATIAGSGLAGYADGVGTEAAFHNPTDVKLDAQDNLWVADFANRRVRRISPQDVVTTEAGSGIKGSRDGQALEAQLGGPVGLAIDASGRIFIADQDSQAIRVLIDGSVRTVAGGREGFTDGFGSNATFNNPQFLAFDNSGNLLVGDLLNHAIRKLRFE